MISDLFDLEFLGSALPCNEGLSIGDAIRNFFADDIREDVTMDQIRDSVLHVSDFFQLDAPTIQRGFTVGVATGLTDITTDDVLLINMDKLLGAGVDTPQSLDLVMTHEGTHRALQAYDQYYTNHQEELCCDTMMGVRIALDGIKLDDIDSLLNELRNTPASLTHPAGDERLAAIEEGYNFAFDYMQKYDGATPTFNECLDVFNKKHNIKIEDLNVGPDRVTLSEKPHTEVGEIKGFTNDAAWHEKEAAWYAERGDYKLAKEHLRSAAICSK